MPPYSQRLSPYMYTYMYTYAYPTYPHAQQAYAVVFVGLRGRVYSVHACCVRMRIYFTTPSVVYLTCRVRRRVPCGPANKEACAQTVSPHPPEK